MQVQVCMRAPAVTCGPEGKLVEVARQMECEEVGSVVVVDTDDRTLGVIITDRDLVNRSAGREGDFSRAVTDPLCWLGVGVHRRFVAC
jgi:signal-transduction protein with cAMP-binding, CBS, and nucleotidyltransferase domain